MFATVQFDDQDPWKPNFLDTSDVERVMHMLAQGYVAIPSYRRQAEAIDMVVECHHSSVKLHLSVRLLSQFMQIHPVHSEPVLSLVGWPSASHSVPLMFTRGPNSLSSEPPRHLVCPLSLKFLQFIVSRHRVHIDVLQDNHYYLMDQWHPELIERICRYAETIFWHQCRQLEGSTPVPMPLPVPSPQAVDPELSSDDTLGDDLEVAKLATTTSLATPVVTPVLPSQASFIGNEENLRHNDFVVIDDLQEVECTYEPDMRAVSSSPVRSVLRPSTRQNRTFSPTKVGSRPATPQSQPVTRQTSFRSPRRLRQSSSVVESTYYIDEFGASSECVPRYIKDNKRLKFIKVGKVQKYVNLFEEKADEVLPSPLRSGPSSPRKQSQASSPHLTHPRSMDAF